jgi:hypothetical protein
MELGIFVQELAALAPSASDLEKSGFSKEEGMRLVDSFLCVKRVQPLPVVSGSDQLLELLREWDLSKVEIGMIRFPEPPTERSGKMCVGCVESDPLVIVPGTGELVVYELGTKEHLLWPVARSGSTLLDAMLIAARFLEQRGTGTIDFNDFKAAGITAAECATAAGGDRYLDFYRMLVGAE